MNFYCITYRLDTDKRDEKRYFEDFAESFDDFISQVISKHRFELNDLFSNVIIIHKSVYKSIFK